MVIKFSDQFKSESSDKIGIRKSHIEPVITNPDKKFELKFDNGIKPIYYVKYIENIKKPFYLLVDTFDKNESTIVNMAWKLLPDLNSEMKYMTPVQMIHAFANRFGLKVTIGDQTDYIFFEKIVKFKKNKNFQLVSVSNPEKHSCVQSMLFKYNEDNGKIIVHCGMVFCIDLDNYLKWINNA